LKTDNSFEMEGSKNGLKEGEHQQTRYKYSPVHQDVAVCCVPNAGRITPYFIQTCWLKEGEFTFVAPLIAPCNVTSSINGHPVSIEESTEYPYSNRVVFKIKSESEASFKLKIRRPQWATSVESNKSFKSEDGFLIFNYDSVSDSVIELEFKTEVRVVEDNNQEMYFRYGALLYALPIEAIESFGRVYAHNFNDLGYKAKDLQQYDYYGNHSAIFKDGMIIAKLRNHDNQKIEEVNLIPIGKTILRQASFKLESVKNN
ncbi:MAG TPA: glycoside hydrolase family 127 protein, partial [Bacteroidales bacterium]|nr:glycoside hydrolase family 127 protein [Bacteroidales bacterium]